MNDFVTLACPSCGGKLQITNDIERFACGYCGLEHQVKRSGGIVSLAPIVEGLRNVQAGVDKTASELAIGRLEKELATLLNQYQQIKAERDITTQWFGGFLGIVMLLIGIAFINSGIYLVGVICFLIGVGVIVLLVRGAQYSMKITKSKLFGLDKEIKEKQSEMAKHRKIVSG